MRFLDPDVMHEWEHRTLAGLEFQAARVEVLEVAFSLTGAPSVSRHVLGPGQLITWLEKKSEDVQVEQPSTRLVQGKLRLILGCCDQKPWYFPFSRRTYQLICTKFRLPRVTTAMISHDQRSFSASHFRVCNVAEVANEDGRPNYGRIGITMKFPGSDLVGMDASISLSHCVAENVTDALVMCRSSTWTSYIAEAVVNLATVATHPAALPAMLCSLHQNILHQRIDLSWNDVFQIENASGQSGIVIVHRGERILPPGKCDDPDLSRKAIGATQLAIAWETYTSGSQALIEAVESFLKSYINDNNFDEVLAEQSQILLEYLGLISQRAESLYCRAKHLRARAEVQVGAINNHLAHRSNQINLSLAYSSQRIAMDAQRDSSIMKSIAVLTMTFLPATYIAVRLSSEDMRSLMLTIQDSLYHSRSGFHFPVAGPVLGYHITDHHYRPWNLDHTDFHYHEDSRQALYCPKTNGKYHNGLGRHPERKSGTGFGLSLDETMTHELELRGCCAGSACGQKVYQTRGPVKSYWRSHDKGEV